MTAPSTPGTKGRPRVLHAVTASIELSLLQGQLRFLREAGFEVAAVSAPGDELEALPKTEGVTAFDVHMERGVSPWADPVSLWDLWQLLRRYRPHITHVTTAKAGLLAGLVAHWLHVPCRLYTLRELRFETATGIRRAVLKRLEKMACDSAHRVICVSGGVRRGAVEAGLVDERHALVLGQGSGNGVDAARFAPTEQRRQRAQGLRERLDIPADSPVIGFVGRMNSERGVPELVCAFARLRHYLPNLRLLLLGDWESADPMPPDMRGILDTDNRILWPGHVVDPAPYYHLMDVVCLPSHGEGFPAALLEAQAAARPVVATTVTGCCDAIEGGVTGLLVPPGDLDALTDALYELLKDPARAQRMGQAGRERVLRDFQPQTIWKALLEEYCSLLKEAGLPLPVPLKKETQEPAKAGVAASG